MTSTSKSALDMKLVESFHTEFDKIIASFDRTWTKPMSKEYYYAQMTEVTIVALQTFKPTKVKVRKGLPGETPERKAAKLATATRKAQRAWVIKHLSGMYCKLGRPIDNARTTKYEPFVRSIIPKFLPACKLFEASMEYEDLCNQLRYEVMLALRDGFDPVGAFSPPKPKMDKKTGKMKEYDPVKIAANQARKLANPLETLEKAEKRSVYERLKNYMQRVRWKFHPDTLGGKSVSYEAVLTETNLDMDGAAESGFTTIEESTTERGMVKASIDALLEAFEDGGDVKAIYASLDESQQESIREYLFSMNDKVDLELKLKPVEESEPTEAPTEVQAEEEFEEM